MSRSLKEFEVFLKPRMKNDSTVNLYVSELERIIEFVFKKYGVNNFLDLAPENIKSYGERLLNEAEYREREMQTHHRARAVINNLLNFLGSHLKIRVGYSAYSEQNENFYRPEKKDENQDVILFENGKKRPNLEKDNLEKKYLNIILYGPPGTGKTYNTINKALEIIDEYVPENREECEERFSELRKSGQIEFITFHQSYSYEDFVEGIKPDLSVENEQMKFRLNEGIFKKICATAEINSKLSASDNKKYLFEDVWQNFIKNVDFSLDEEKEVPMKTTSFFIYDYNDTTIRFRKKVGKSIHTLAFATLKKMFYEGKNDIISGGLEPYYSALLSQLMEISGTINNEFHELKNYVLIIDEINRGNISRIFGELITLIEEDKRDGRLTVKLPYSQEDFTVPSNLFIIGTMNTADRSIALLDIALRRRFTFFRFDPRPELVENTKAKEIMIKLNEKIKEYKGADFQIGHSYFMKVTNDEELETVLKYKINPLLEEYFVNDHDKLKKLKEFAGIKIDDNN